jgi:NTP pyrophosphatase (non-canonical NTP hydrolase)/ribosomal protein S27E
METKHTVSHTAENLTMAQRERLAWLAEECGEVVQAVGKVLRHGFQDTGPNGTTYDNRVALEEEAGHVLAVIDTLAMNGDVQQSNVKDSCGRKKVTCRPHMHYQLEVKEEPLLARCVWVTCGICQKQWWTPENATVLIKCLYCGAVHNSKELIGERPWP